MTEERDLERTTRLQEAIELAVAGVRAREGGPFGALVVRNGEVVGRGCNRVTSRLDPTAHAEIESIRDACERLGTFDLGGCEIYASCQPCPMCLGAICWARIDRIWYAASSAQAAAAGFDDEEFYRELDRPSEERKVPMVQLPVQSAAEPFRLWLRTEGRIEY